VIEARRIAVKLFFDGAPPAPADARALFHRAIRDRLLDEVLIDVADYSHVHHGPGVVLVGHAANYSLDSDEGRPGLTCARKRDEPADFAARLSTATRATLAACHLIERETSARFRTDEILFRINDRLHAPNDASTFALVLPFLEQLCVRLFSTEKATIAPSGDSKTPFGARATVARAPSLDELLARIA